MRRTVKFKDEKGKLHCIDGPAVIKYDGSRIVEEYWYWHGLQHRLNGPAHTWYFLNGKPKWEEYFTFGLKHRGNGPASILYFRTGQVEMKQWFYLGLHHRIYEPSKIRYNKDGSLASCEYYYMSSTVFGAHADPKTTFDDLIQQRERDGSNWSWSVRGQVEYILDHYHDIQYPEVQKFLKNLQIAHSLV
jgi:hypothetical protein